MKKGSSLTAYGYVAILIKLIELLALACWLNSLSIQVLILLCLQSIVVVTITILLTFSFLCLSFQPAASWLLFPQVVAKSWI